LDPLELRNLSHEGLWSAAGAAFRYFDLGATFLWGSSGAVLAARRGYDLTGMFAIAVVSSCGGGLLRDALFLQAGPPVLVRTPHYVLIALLATLITWLLNERWLGKLPKAMTRGMQIADAIGLGAFAVVGMRLALAASIGVAGAALVGVVNAVGGGILRSILLRRTPEVFRPGELTALAALGGTVAYGTLAVALRSDENLAALVAIAITTGLRWVSVHFRLRTRAAWSRAPGGTH
jgi:uncharacterized membrane protein YeiH